MVPFRLELKNEDFGIVVHCKKYFGMINRKYYLSEESTGYTTIWRSCLTNEVVDGTVMTSYLLLHLLVKIKEFYSHQNYC